MAEYATVGDKDREVARGKKPGDGDFEAHEGGLTSESQTTPLAPEIRRKNRRRGRPFERGNTVGRQGRQFPKGKSGNPGGRPPDAPSAKLRESMAMKH